MEAEERPTLSDLSEEESRGAEGEVSAKPPGLYDQTSDIRKWAPRSRFFHVVSILERLMPDRVRVGGDGPPQQEGFRFRHDPALAFSAGDITSVTERDIAQEPGSPLSKKLPGFEITSTFLGLTGAVSPLPLYMPEEVALEDQDHRIRRDFLDLFHHRILSLLYRSVARYSPTREHVAKEVDPWLRRFLAVAGLDRYSGPLSEELPEGYFLRLLPLFASRSRTRDGLELALHHALGDALGGKAKIQIEQFVGRRVEVDSSQRSQLGVKNHILGQNSVLGGRVYDRSNRFAIRIGPLDSENYQGFMEGGQQLSLMRTVVASYCRRPLDYDVRLDLAADAVPQFRLSTSQGRRLGRQTWLRGQQAAQVHVIRDAMHAENAPAAP